ncbi:MAG TPA: cobalamin-independent methionine synthase II family protein [Candidatus Sulfotelmatobacter sp.]|nr:cobalamin-independent methionine synthase II family protein [Candidatus Sulfotelmatobacter sp.]
MPSGYRADHVGSLLRPPALLQARQSSTDGEQLRKIEDEFILEAIRRQNDIGLDILTDGELRRRNFMSDFVDAVAGFDTAKAVSRSWSGHTKSGSVSSVTGVVTSKLRQMTSLTGRELPFLETHAHGNIKVTLPSANQFPAISYQRGITDKIYPTPSDLLWDIVAIMKREMQSLSSQGISYVQIDAPRYSYYIDAKWREWIRKEMLQDPQAALLESVDADNACFAAARRPGVTLAIHLCRGNNQSHWYAEGGYDAIAEQLFGTLDVDRFLLEYDDERSGSFEPLRFVPPGKIVVLGLISSKRPKLEDKVTLIRRINEASRYIPLENLALSPSVVLRRPPREIWFPKPSSGPS